MSLCACLSAKLIGHEISRPTSQGSAYTVCPYETVYLLVT